MHNNNNDDYNKRLERNLLNYIFEYDNEKEIKKRIKLLNAKYSLNLNQTYLDSFALYSDSLKDILDTSEQPSSTPSKEITTRDVNTFIDFLAKLKFSYNHIDMEGDIKKLRKLYNKVGINIDDDTAEKMLKYYFSEGKLDKSKLESLYKIDDNDYVKPSNESKNLRAFNIFLKSLENTKIEELFNKVYENNKDVDEDEDSKKKFEIFKELFSDSNGKFKISSISKLF